MQGASYAMIGARRALATSRQANAADLKMSYVLFSRVEAPERLYQISAEEVTPDGSWKEGDDIIVCFIKAPLGQSASEGGQSVTVGSMRVAPCVVTGGSGWKTILQEDESRLPNPAEVPYLTEATYQELDKYYVEKITAPPQVWTDVANTKLAVPPASPPSKKAALKGVKDKGKRGRRSPSSGRSSSDRSRTPSRRKRSPEYATPTREAKIEAREYKVDTVLVHEACERHAVEEGCLPVGEGMRLYEKVKRI